jgi:hypothetical protein
MPAQASAEKKQEWQNIILRQRQSGLSINRWCQENHIATSVFYYWQKKLFPKQPLSRSSFTELAEEKQTGFTIEYGDFQIHFDPQFDSSSLKRFLNTLRETKC